MHILDFLMYWVLLAIIWGGLHFFSGGNLTEELGGLVGLRIVYIFTIIYIVIFCVFPDLNWIDIFRGTYNVNFSEWFKL